MSSILPCVTMMLTDYRHDALRGGIMAVVGIMVRLILTMIRYITESLLKLMQ